MADKQFAIVIDLDRCIGCRGGCQVACKTEHKIALGESRSKLYTIGPTGSFPRLQMYFMAVMCQQCDNPSCVKVCTTGACYKDKNDGVVYIDQERCIGCQSCKRACPYDVPIFNKEMQVADKCNICSDLRKAGEDPACVKNCSGSAILYGDVNDTDSKVSRAIAEAGDNVYSLQDKGNKPVGKFILRNAEWIDKLPAEFVEELKEKYK